MVRARRALGKGRLISLDARSTPSPAEPNKSLDRVGKERRDHSTAIKALSLARNVYRLSSGRAVEADLPVMTPARCIPLLLP